MNILIPFCFVVFSTLFTSSLSKPLKKPYYDLKDAEQLFEKFIKKYHRVYKDAQDRQIHFEAFKNGLIKINKLNAEQPLAVFDINNFADNTPEEMKMHFGINVPPYNKPYGK
ncbi:cathepsin propeptide inhibitor domain (I29) domain-containing protein [Phthorimaea operculella]|nr:cathepsin propeptide inhibitor domain (I29) domain-containing protein [Phthorimaea operculella]